MTDGITTSITPVAGGLPGQTMGDSFGGVLLVLSDGEHTALQRVGFTSGVAPWRWVSAGDLSGIVQTHDGTIFATERVSDGQGTVTAASVVVLDGATGSLRSRVAITTSTYVNTWHSDGWTNCQGEEPQVREGVGATGLWALTTADVYGVVTVEEDHVSANCPEGGGTSTGHAIGAQHLLTVDRNGASTMEQLSQYSQTFPSNQGGFSTPPANKLGRDARGNLVVTFENEERQLFGPEPNAHALPVGEGSIVSEFDVHVARVGDVLRATNVATGLQVWDALSPGEPIGFASGREAVLVLSGGAVFEVGPEAIGASASTPGAQSLHQSATSRPGYLTYITATSLMSVSIPYVHPARVVGTTGNHQRQGSPRRRPEFDSIDEAGLAALREYFPLGMERRVEYGGSVCRLATGRFVYADANIGTEGFVEPTACPAGVLHFGEYHTHSPCGNPGPSGPDVHRLRVFNTTNPDARGYVGVPAHPLPYAIKYHWPVGNDIPTLVSMATLTWPKNRRVTCF